MNIREMTEQWETEYLSPYASMSRNTRGRERQEELCDIRPEYQRDRDRILHSKAFRRLKHKTQVFLDPEGDHYRTRLTHTLEVSQIARTIARALRLNEALTEAIALGHDHDIDDAIRAKLFTEEDLPSEYTDILGHSVRERLNTMIHDLIYQSLDRPEIAMSPGMEAAMHGLRQWLCEKG